MREQVYTVGVCTRHQRKAIESESLFFRFCSRFLCEVWEIPAKSLYHIHTYILLYTSCRLLECEVPTPILFDVRNRMCENSVNVYFAGWRMLFSSLSSNEVTSVKMNLCVPSKRTKTVNTGWIFFSFLTQRFSSFSSVLVLLFSWWLAFFFAQFMKYVCRVYIRWFFLTFYSGIYRIACTIILYYVREKSWINMCQTYCIQATAK